MDVERKVVSLHGGAVQTPYGEPVAEIIDLLEEALADARSGRVRAIGICYSLEDGDPQPLVKTCWHNEPRTLPNLLLALTRLRIRIEKIIHDE